MVLGRIEYVFNYTVGISTSDMAATAEVVKVGMVDSKERLMTRIWNDLRKDGYSLSIGREYNDENTGDSMTSYLIYLNLDRNLEIDRDVSPFQNEAVWSSYKTLVRDYKLNKILYEK